MNLTTLIKKKETLFDNKKFTKALDDIFGGEFNNKATIDEHSRLIIQYTSKLEGCIVFVSNKSADTPYIEAHICQTKNPDEGSGLFYQSQTIKTTATLRQFKKFLASVIMLHYYIAKQVEINHAIGKEVVKLSNLEKQVE